MNGNRNSDTTAVELDEELCWRAVEARDARFIGSFVAGVRTTGVYCRPNCPARRPRRDRVVFFSTPAEAERAGFRACRRCEPDVEPAYDAQLELVRRVCRKIEESPEPPTLDELGATVGLSPHHLQRTFKRVMGVSPAQYARALRVGALKSELRNGRPVTDALYLAGYGSSSRLYAGASAELGMTPKVYRQGGRGMRIGYTIVDSALGRLLVAATERGVCAVNLADNDPPLEAALRAEYPEAEIDRDEAGLSRWVGAILGYLGGQLPRLDLPVDIRATAFQRRVWEELRRIPYGATRSYKEVAEAIGKPNAARAVGRACATNPVPLVIPCHRVVGEDGSLHGYGLGIERKRALLAKEQTATVLFTDVEGSTELTGRLGDAKARDVLRRYDEAVREALAAHGGLELKTMGDGFMAAFSSATRGLACAAAIERAVAECEPPVRVRVGVNAGEPVAEGGDLFGTSVIVAARIAAKAAGGEVFVSDVVRQLVAGKGFVFADRGGMVLRGFEEPVRLYELRWQAGSPASE